MQQEKRAARAAEGSSPGPLELGFPLGFRR